ncbi:MAG: NHL repeat-containing protein [Sulfobacillus sp.]
MTSVRQMLWSAILLSMTFLAVSLWGWRRVTVWNLSSQPHMAWQANFGTHEGNVGDAHGLDGRRYGPLAFSLLGQEIVVADSYKGRIIVTGPHPQQFSVSPLMVEDMAVTGSGSVIVADNRQLEVWMLRNREKRLLIKVPQARGMTQAIWHLAVGSRGEILLQIVGFGHGQFEMRLNEYNRAGRFIRELSRATGGEGSDLTPLAGHGPLGLIRDFEVSPAGELYVEPPSNERFHRQIDIYHWNGQYAGGIVVSSPEPIQDSQFLGVNRWGWVYLGINLNQPHQARVLVVSPHGTILNDMAVHAVPVYSAVYGRVSPKGSLYLVQSTPSHYRIEKWTLVSHRVWRWIGWGNVLGILFKNAGHVLASDG